MREIRQSGSEGGAKLTFVPTPIIAQEAVGFTAKRLQKPGLSSVTRFAVKSDRLPGLKSRQRFAPFLAPLFIGHRWGFELI